MSKEQKGILNPDQEKFLAKLMDEKVKFSNPLIEVVDGVAFKLAITLLDDNLLEKIPADWKNPISPIVDAAIEGRWNEVATAIANLADEKIDVPGIDDLSEKLLFHSVVGIIFSLLMGKIEKLW